MGKRERPAPPADHVYLADVLAVVRTHANANSWCGEAEGFIRDTFGLDEDALPDPPNTMNWCCTSCDGPRPGAKVRLTLTDPTKVIRVSRLKDAVRQGMDAYADGDDDEDYRAMFRELIDTFGLPVKPPA